MNKYNSIEISNINNKGMANENQVYRKGKAD